ncbi:638_t:CDS:1, partial [Dentiscutata heterogama]
MHNARDTFLQIVAFLDLFISLVILEEMTKSDIALSKLFYDKMTNGITQA